MLFFITIATLCSILAATLLIYSWFTRKNHSGIENLFEGLFGVFIMYINGFVKHSQNILLSDYQGSLQKQITDSSIINFADKTICY